MTNLVNVINAAQGSPGILLLRAMTTSGTLNWCTEIVSCKFHLIQIPSIFAEFAVPQFLEHFECFAKVISF